MTVPAPRHALARATSVVVAEALAIGDGRTMLVTVSPVHLAPEARGPSRLGLSDAPEREREADLWGTVTLEWDITLQHEIDRMKSDFAATVSDEMRTP